MTVGADNRVELSRRLNQGLSNTAIGSQAKYPASGLVASEAGLSHWIARETPSWVCLGLTGPYPPHSRNHPLSPAGPRSASNSSASGAPCSGTERIKRGSRAKSIQGKLEGVRVHELEFVGAGCSSLKDEHASAATRTTTPSA